MAIAQASTADVPIEERLRFWEAYTASELIGVRCSSFSASGLLARQRNFHLGDLHLAEIAGNEHVVERTQPIMRCHPKDSLFACMLIEGEAFFYQYGRCVPMREGDLIIYRTTTPYLYGVTRQMRQVQVDIPVETVMETLPLPDVLAPIKIDGALHAGRALMQPLRREMLEFIEQPLADHAEAASRRIRSMVQMLMQAHLTERAHGRDLRLLRAEAFIAERLCDPELDAEAVARHLSMSLRNLNRIFERRECSVTQWIWRERLALARRMLADSAHAGLTIGTIALQCGFATQAHFAHAFKEEFGLTPSEHRLGARASG